MNDQDYKKVAAWFIGPKGGKRRMVLRDDSERHRGAHPVPPGAL